MNKIRVRFGVNLSWPITNVAIVVFYATKAQFDQLIQAIGVVKLVLGSAGQTSFADRIVCEQS